MSEALVLPDSLASRAPIAPAFVCSWTAGGPDAAWMHVVGELDLATAPRLEQTLLQPQLHERYRRLGRNHAAGPDRA
jgi:hypothetical protein